MGHVPICILGQNIGSEVYGKAKYFTRPVLVYKKLSGNIFLGIPLTSQAKIGNWYITLNFKGKSVTMLLNQIKIFDKKRLIDRFGHISDSDLLKIKQGFLALYGT